MTEFPADYDYLLKIVLVGDQFVGKSYILSQYIREDFDLENRNTIGVEFDQKYHPTQLGKPQILVQLWDTSGQEKLLSAMPSFFRAATGALLIFDVTKYQTFQNCQKWIEMIKQMADQTIQILLVANKIDLNNLRIVSSLEAKSFADLHSIKYIEVSALTGENIQAAIGVVVSDIQVLIDSNMYDVTTDKAIHLRHRVDISKRNQCCGTGGMV